MVWPTYLSLFKLLAENDDDLLRDLENEPSIVTNMKRLGREYMKKNENDFEPSFYHKAMTFLTPAMKKLPIISLSERLKLHSDIESYIKQHFVSESLNLDQTSDDIPSRDQDFLEIFEMFDEDERTSNTELSKYSIQAITSQVDVAKWWYEHSTVFPNLFRLFLKLSCVPATTGSSERNFSTSGNIVTDKRSVILPSNVNNLIVARNVV